MSDHSLDLPYVAVIPYNVQIDSNLSDGAKLYFGQIVAFAKKCGYMWATDGQLAEMKGVSKRTIERWNQELDAAGHIRRVTANVPVKNPDGKYNWVKKRKIYFNDAFGLGPVKPNPDPLPLEETLPLEEAVLFEDSGSAENVLSLGSAENGAISGCVKNDGITNNSLDQSLNLQPGAPPAVVVFSSLSKISISDELKIKITNDHSESEVDLAVERCLKWKSRPNDATGVMTALKRASNWFDNPSPKQKEDENSVYLLTLKHLDGKILALTSVCVGHNYIEFVRGPKVEHFKIMDPEFKTKVVNYLEYLRQLDEKM